MKKLNELIKACKSRNLQWSISDQRINDIAVEIYQGQGSGYKTLYYTDGHLTLKPAIKNALAFVHDYPLDRKPYGRLYEEDKPLFKWLGFEAFEAFDQEPVFVGEYQVPDHDKAKIKVWAKHLPSQFWRLEITTVEGGTFTMNTGTVFLHEVWPSAIQIATDTIAISPTPQTI